MSQNQNGISSRFFKPKLKPKLVLLNCHPGQHRLQVVVRHAHADLGDVPAVRRLERAHAAHGSRAAQRAADVAPDPEGRTA